MSKPPKQLTLSSVAEACGVSPSTVSRAFSRPDLVRADVRERVLEMAASLGYKPNRIARSLATGRLGMIGLVVTDITNPFFPPLVRAVQRAAKEHEWSVMLMDADELGAEEESMIDWVRRQVDGVILASPRSSDEVLEPMLASIPSVIVNREVPGQSCIVVDHTEALAAAGEELRRLGHERFALLRGPEQSWAALERARAVEAWAGPAGVQLVDLGAHPATFEAGQEVGRSLAGSDVTAVFAFDDLGAAGLVAGLHDVGLRVPEDVSVVGCDDVLLARTSTPSLTTVAAPMDELGARAVALLRDAFAQEEPVVEQVEGTLVLRGSTAAAR